MKSYCVKQKIQTEHVPGSETYSTTKNGRGMMKCKCAECGITKTKLVAGSSTGQAKPSISRTTTTKKRGRSRKTGQG